MKRRLPPAAWRHWVYFGALACLVTLLEGIHRIGIVARTGDATSFGGALSTALMGVGPTLFLTLPVIAAVSTGLMRPTAAARRRALQMVVAVILVMLALDMAPGSVLTIGSPETELREGGEVRSHARQPGFTEVSMIGVVQGAVSGELGNISERRPSYPPGHPRWLASQAVMKLGLVLQVPILVGMTLGITFFVESRVTFRSPVDQRVVRLLLAWITAPMVAWLLFRASIGTRHDALFRDGSLLSILWPYLPFVVLGALGWEFASRSATVDPGAIGADAGHPGT